MPHTQSKHTRQGEQHLVGLVRRTARIPAHPTAPGPSHLGNRCQTPKSAAVSKNHKEWIPNCQDEIFMDILILPVSAFQWSANSLPSDGKHLTHLDTALPSARRASPLSHSSHRKHSLGKPWKKPSMAWELTGKVRKTAPQCHFSSFDSDMMLGQN